VAEDLFTILTKFHREVVIPDIQRIVTTSEERLQGEMNARFVEVYGHFDAIYQRFDRLGLKE